MNMLKMEKDLKIQELPLVDSPGKKPGSVQGFIIIRGSNQARERWSDGALFKAVIKSQI